MFVVSCVALDVTKAQIAKAKVPAGIVIGQADKPVGNELVLRIVLCFIVIAGLAHAKDCAG